MDEMPRIEHWLTVDLTHTGVYWCNSVQQWFILDGYVGHNAGKALAATNTSNLHGKLVEIDATLLGPRTSLASGSLGSLANSPHPVRFSFILTTIRRQLDCSLMFSEVPAWKRLISHPLAAHERISLINTIFLDNNQVEMVGRLQGEDAQTFIDIIDEVSPHNFTPKGQSNFDLNLHILSTRRWIASYQRSAGSVYSIYTGFVATKPDFRNHWQSCLVTSKD